jgi:hypothetical protein
MKMLDKKPIKKRLTTVDRSEEEPVESEYVELSFNNYSVFKYEWINEKGLCAALGGTPTFVSCGSFTFNTLIYLIYFVT